MDYHILSPYKNTNLDDIPLRYCRPKTKNKIFIGTSGYEYPAWNKCFYPSSKNHLGFFSKNFNCVEINTTFYGTPLTSTIKKWVSEVEDNPSFQFVIKVSKFITHSKKLNDFVECWNNFWNGSKDKNGKERGGIHYLHQSNRLSCLLFQFPPNFKNTKGNLEKLKTVKETVPVDINCAFEFRDSSWYDGKVADGLFTKNWMLVHPILNNSLFESGWAGDLKDTDLDHFNISDKDFIYLRFHGTKGRYVGSYDQDLFLEKLASIICSGNNKQIYVMFNNTDSTFCHQIPFIVGNQYLLMKTNELNQNATIDLVCCLHDGLYLNKLVRLFQ
jgi:uncharacterized protein YecE (DUF72 family)